MQLAPFIIGVIVTLIVIAIWSGVMSMVDYYKRNKREKFNEIYRIKVDISMLMSSKELIFSRLYNIEKQLKELKQRANDGCQ